MVVVVLKETFRNRHKWHVFTGWTPFLSHCQHYSSTTGFNIPKTWSGPISFPLTCVQTFPFPPLPLSRYGMWGSTVSQCCFSSKFLLVCFYAVHTNISIFTHHVNFSSTHKSHNHVHSINQCFSVLSPPILSVRKYSSLDKTPLKPPAMQVSIFGDCSKPG